MFTSQDELRVWGQKPFAIGDKAFATDFHNMVIFDKHHVPEVLELADYPHKNVLGVIRPHEGAPRILAVEMLQAILKSCPLVPEESDCEECLGDGFDNNGLCPACHGVGFVNNPDVMVLDAQKGIRIGDSILGVWPLDKMCKAATLLGEVTITMVRQADKNDPAIFTFSDIELHVMGSLDQGEASVIYTIE